MARRLARRRPGAHERPPHDDDHLRPRALHARRLPRHRSRALRRHLPLRVGRPRRWRRHQPLPLRPRGTRARLPARRSVPRHQQQGHPHHLPASHASRLPARDRRVGEPRRHERVLRPRRLGATPRARSASFGPRDEPRPGPRLRMVPAPDCGDRGKRPQRRPRRLLPLRGASRARAKARDALESDRSHSPGSRSSPASLSCRSSCVSCGRARSSSSRS